MTPALAQRCKRLRHRQSECRICQEVCPEGAITLDPGPAVSERCTRCGLCQAACPTEVFQGEVHSDQHLLSRIGPMLLSERGAAEGRPLFVHCREAELQQRDAVAVPCLGSVTATFLLGAAARGANPLTFVHGDCSGCRLRAGKELFAKTMAAHLALAPAVGLDRSALKLEQRQQSNRASSARRKFLARLTGCGAQGVGGWPAPGIETRGPFHCTTATGGGPTPGRALLHKLLKGVAWSPSTSLRCDVQLPWASVRIDQRDCATCGTCVNLCPTGAISHRIDNGRLSHYFSSALCVNCRLCEETCPQGVISFAPEFDARDLVRGAARSITSIRLHACGICGETLPEREGRFCFTCRRRGRVYNYIPGAVACIRKPVLEEQR